ncbi:unnamed protein product [Nesidiocoris tenuis]|uniref:VWF/SSPO/Zonadhesin-like cysteine-rich domain-containing protein n=1 Tax=Nesidiocoris tenuis TaxID=355587 RepID=A0A6H5GTY5_9HEMI|nr:unnamed protein product [Nesidiocoris tenuis]
MADVEIHIAPTVRRISPSDINSDQLVGRPLVCFQRWNIYGRASLLRMVLSMRVLGGQGCVEGGRVETDKAFPSASPSEGELRTSGGPSSSIVAEMSSKTVVFLFLLYGCDVGFAIVNQGQMPMGQMPMDDEMGQMPMGQEPMGDGQMFEMGQVPVELAGERGRQQDAHQFWGQKPVELESFGGQEPMGQEPMGQEPMGQEPMGQEIESEVLHRPFDGTNEFEFGMLRSKPSVFPAARMAAPAYRRISVPALPISTGRTVNTRGSHVVVHRPFRIIQGERVQTTASACDVRSLSFNGNYKCNSNSNKESLECVLRCPDGMKMAGKSAAASTESSVHVCSYANGTFYPPVAPRCVFASEKLKIFDGQKFYSAPQKFAFEKVEMGPKSMIFSTDSKLKIQWDLQLINPEEFLETCKWDYCACEIGGLLDHDCGCKSIEMYVKECRDHGVEVSDWRSPSFCRK